MADSESKRTETKRKKKRKTNRNLAEETIVHSSKKQRIPPSEQASEPQTVEEETGFERTVQILPGHEVEEGLQWKNLDLILSIENKGLDVHKKLELAFDFVTSIVKEGNDDDEDCKTVKMSRVVVFLSDWVQSLLVSSKKRIGAREKPDIDVRGSYLDFRCWKIFKFCLEDSIKLQVSLTFSKNILESIRFFAEDMLSELTNMSSRDIDSYFNREGSELHRSVLDCVDLVFSRHGGLSNESLGLWISTVNAVVELVSKVHAERADNGNAGLYVLKLSCSLFEPFAKFLRANPTNKKNGFHDFVYELLEPLLHLLGILHHKVDGCFPDWKSKLLKLAEDVLSYGLFHPVQIDGFFGLNSTEKYIAQNGENEKESRTVIKSYHRHLFAKLEEIVAAKKDLASCSMGKLISLLAARVKNLKGATVVSEHSKVERKIEIARHLEGGVNPTSGKIYSSTYLTADKRKSLFDVFVLIMEPLLLETNGYLKLEHGVGPVLSDVSCTLKSINSLLGSLTHEKIYLRTEDTSEGACLNFLKKVYDSILSLSSAFIRSSDFDVHARKEMEMLASSNKESLVAIGYLLEVEYNVVRGDLTSLWLMMLSYLALDLSLTNEAGQSLLFSKIADLGGQLFSLFSQLRQVNNAIFPLCKAIRLLISNDDQGDVNHIRFLAPLHDEAYAESMGMLICSEGFKLAIQKAIKSIPEGQASTCLQQLIADISESLKWMKVRDVVADEKKSGKLNIGNRFNLQAELLGRGLSELYALVLNSLTVTTGNSYLVGKSVKDLITLLCPCMSSLVGLQPYVVNEFLFSVVGKRFHSELNGRKSDLQSFRFSAHWIFVFFFQLYMSCRVLYRQAASLMPPDSLKKLSASMGDSFTTLSGQDWIQKTDWKNDGYFACIVQPSASLDVVIRAVSDIYVQDTDVDCSSLIYLMNAMTLQRLIDLNRHIKALDYLLQNNDCLLQITLLDDDDMSRYHRKSKKMKRRISNLRQEAADLTDLMMEYLSVLSKNQQPISIVDDADHGGSSALKNGEWDFSVSSLNKELLPTAMWWILCQNIDVWSIHAAKKKLKTFLSVLLRSSIPFGRNSRGQAEKDNGCKTNRPNRINMWNISLELLNNSILYEQRFVCRYLASRFCHVLEESASAFISGSSGNADIMSSPNWTEVFSGMENSLPIVSCNKNTSYGCLPTAKPVTSSSREALIKNNKELDVSSLSSMELSASQSLLALLSWIPKDFFSSKSFSQLLRSILNLERLVIGSLLDCQGTVCYSKVKELFKLFMSCRKVMKYIVIAACEKKSSETVVSFMYSEKSFPIIWLFKSLFVVVGIQSSLSKDSATQVDDTIFSLLDHTLYVFLTLSKYHFSHAVHSIGDAQDSCKEEQNNGMNNEQSDVCLSSSSYVEFWKSVSHVAKSLREQMQSSLDLLKDAIPDGKRGFGATAENLNMFSSAIACFSGFLWGLVSILKQIAERSTGHKAVLSRWKDKPNIEINFCVSVFEELSRLLLGMLLLNDSQYFQNATNKDRTCMDKFVEISNGGMIVSCPKEQDKIGALMPSASSDINGDSKPATVCSKKFKSTGSKSVASFLTGVDSLEDLPIDKLFLRNLLKGDCAEAAFLLRELFIASSAVLGLKLHVSCAPLSARLMQTLTGISQALLMEFVGMVDVGQSLSFVWLDGIVKYLEELGNHFPLTDPTLSRNIYVKLVELHLRAIGKCISLEGKRATLASHETESSTKRLPGHSGLSEVCISSKLHGLDELKSRLRMSFTVFIRKPSELHLLSSVQAIERALVGVREKSAMIYDIQSGSENGGKVSSNVAAGIDCLDLILESVTGRKRMNVVKRHMRSLMASAFNIILHLQTSLIFYETSMGGTDPDPGAIVLMCVVVLKRISGKHALYQMDTWHVAQSLRIPGALFQNFHRLKLSKTPCESSSFTVSSDHTSDPAGKMQICGVDRKFSVDLFAACCRLLYNILKHHNSELKRCIAVLEASVSALLHCLETRDYDSTVRSGYFSWEVEEGVQCAYCLRRIYEEVRHQKEILGRHCAQFLSNYIWVYSGHGPLKTGIKREIDEALRPGVYALIDACSPADLQHLHTVFGEGSCRNNLAALQRDYKLNFLYEGKV